MTHRMPQYKESYAITFVDKYAAIVEFSVWVRRGCCLTSDRNRLFENKDIRQCRIAVKKVLSGSLLCAG